MEKNSIPVFLGECISMMLINESHSHDLNNPHFEYQGGCLFIVGTIPEIATESGSMLYTWQYNLRWAAQKLRDDGVLNGRNDLPRELIEVQNT